MPYCIYLRKSRADVEAEAHGEGETLARHEKLLIELAQKRALPVTQIYREIVSGETIAARPVMQQLLSEVEQGLWTGVLVVEIERLARGDTIDQGIVSQTFKYSSTKIITPLKTYDPNNEYDEEYFEFGLFMSRREYKTINRRLQRGRSASVKEGKYVGSAAPYGYERVRLTNDKGYTLRPVEDEAAVIRLIYEYYTTGEQQPDGSFKRLGVSLICRRLNDMHIPAKRGGAWSVGTIRDILINPVYAGKVRWNWRKETKKMTDGKLTTSRPRSGSDEYFITDGLHPAIISQETFDAAQHFMSQNPPRPVGEKNTVQNPLAGIITCGKCGRKMVRRPYNKRGYPDALICAATSCDNISSPLSAVEDALLQSLRDWVTAYKLKWNITQTPAPAQSDAKRAALDKRKEDLNTLTAQLDKTYDLLEQGIYSTDTFLTRSRSLNDKITAAKEDVSILEKDLSDALTREKAAVDIVPKIEHLLSVYHDLQSPKSKNDLLKEVLERATYLKVKKNTRKKTYPDNIQVEVEPRVQEK